MTSLLPPEIEFRDPNDFYTVDEANRYNLSNGMKRTQEMLTKIALDLSQPLSENKLISILDIGCGTGFSLEYLRFNGYLNIKGIDPSKEMIKISKQKKLNVKIGGFEDINKITEKYDLIISISALQWVISNKKEIEIKNILKKIAKDIKNILKKNGVCVIQFYPDKKEILDIIESCFKRFFLDVNIYIYNPDSFKKKKIFLILKN